MTNESKAGWGPDHPTTFTSHYFRGFMEDDGRPVCGDRRVKAGPLRVLQPVMACKICLNFKARGESAEPRERKIA